MRRAPSLTGDFRLHTAQSMCFLLALTSLHSYLPNLTGESCVNSSNEPSSIFPGYCVHVPKQLSTQNDGAPPLKPRLPRALFEPFAGMDDRTQFHTRVYFRSCSRACTRAAAVSMIYFASHEPRFTPRRKSVDRLGGFGTSSA